MRKLEIVIRPDGTVEIDAVGFKGNACEAATKPLREALGGVENENRKPEWHEKVNPDVRQTVRNSD